MMKLARGSIIRAAMQITTSLRYRCPPGTGIPKELKTTTIAVNNPVSVIQIGLNTFIFSFFIR